MKTKSRLGTQAQPQLPWRNLSLAVASILVCLVLLEGAIRIRQWIRYGSTRVDLGGALISDPATNLMIPEPGSSTGNISINSLGFRGPEIPLEKPDHTIRLAFIGASTTFCAEASSNQMTWPDLVVQRLRHDYPETHFDYVNGGVAGYKTSESLINLRRRIRPLSPDVIVIYHATNDLAFEVSRLAAAEGLNLQQRHDWLEQRSLAWLLIKKNTLIAYRMRQAREGRHRLLLEGKNFSLGFEERLSQLIVESKKQASLVAIATFSYKVRQDQTPEVKAKSAEIAIFYMPSLTPESLLFGYQEFNRVIDKLALDHDLVLVQGELDIPADDQHFADTFHFRDLGNRKMAERVSSALASSPEFVRLVQGQELDPTIHLAEEPPHS